MSQVSDERKQKGDVNLRRQAWRSALKPVPEIFDWYRVNAFAGTVLAGAYLTVKGFVIAKGSITNALGILQYEGLVSVVVAGLFTSLPILAGSMLAITIYRFVRSMGPAAPEATGPATPKVSIVRRSSGFRFAGLWRHDPLIAVMLSALVLSALFTPYPYMLAAIILGALAGRTRRKWSVLATDVLGGLVALISVISILYNSWLPHEIVTFKAVTAAGNPPKQVLGYVLADDPDGWITILLSGQHSIARYRDSSVSSLTVCSRVPHSFFSDIFEASTIWEASTRAVGGRFTPANDESCSINSVNPGS
jgi:hypothetical protein